MAEHFNKLTPAEAERLALLAEEMGEVQQVIGKILRHGYFSTHPDGGPTNQERLETELGDVVCAIHLIWEKGDISKTRVVDHSIEKLTRVYKYLHHQTDPATE